jgi:hypothetical protein
MKAWMQQSLHRLIPLEVIFHDLWHIFWFHLTVPSAIGQDLYRRPRATLSQTVTGTDKNAL